MKILTLNFLTCARKLCKSSNTAFPLHPQDAELEIVEQDMNVEFLRNILPRLMWEELSGVVGELGLPALPPTVPTLESLTEKKLKAAENDPTGMNVVEVEVPSQVALDLHRLLLETCVKEGKLVCGSCGHEYQVREGIANFLLPGHLV
ncbi:Trm112p-domain-containing protein [Delitschia confertaspora ATCC 74209]|uniref:Trm112p-domain-containing protein n=1 Tax=Delitschia confertaspora ATCC 74209 TaxID=1513339 RepID=A0A9P4JFM1_9PLEO|nr:Trm112p-domain-containing protein [Delitschia confertaspora ATCC 74209]